MRALRLMGRRPDPVLAGVADPSPGPGQAGIWAGGVGACHCGPHLMRDFEAGQQLGWGPPAPAGCSPARSRGMLSSCPRRVDR